MSCRIVKGCKETPNKLSDEIDNIDFELKENSFSFALQMVVVAQLVRASDCGSEGRGFEPPHPPQFNSDKLFRIFSCLIFTGWIL